MVLLLAPYNEAMRLGMGFNSFTQHLCINDAVKAPGNTPVTEQSLRPQQEHDTTANADRGNGNIAQEVSWTAKFVDRLSEVTDSLNIGGSLQIKCDAIGGGGNASASFVDTNKFKESDINYLIQVRVTNQRLVCPDLTEFDLIENLPESEFSRVYGDTFISGFTYGGEFNALVSIKLADHTTAKDIRGKLQIDMNMKAAEISGSGEGAKTNALSKIDAETTIAVSWRGGGDIKSKDVTDWTLDTLKQVAIAFPERIMACPLRTNAILTKYTSLKSFYSKKIKGTPLDYENAGVYSAALLDAYMDYKIMWRNIHNAIWEVEQGQSKLTAKEKLANFAELSKEAQSHHQKQLSLYKKGHLESNAARPDSKGPDNPPPIHSTPSFDSDVPDTKSVDTKLVDTNSLATGSPDASDAEDDIQPESKSDLLAKPMPPNEIVPYEPTIFGLEKAQRDCRFEMIKIVREVDAVADDPQIACDPERTWEYLSPSIFRMLLPTVQSLEKEKPAPLPEKENK
ncbi:hypothetical protein BDW22DRAFT_1359593 [Trametopsis cervina]|nr:hypothetical protein BDW22DRAFT_1359593 [Trametopsis cervina]